MNWYICSVVEFGLLVVVSFIAIIEHLDRKAFEGECKKWRELGRQQREGLK